MEHGFDTSMDDTLIKYWVNPTRRLLDDDYRPILTYVEPSSDGYWDIAISPNFEFVPVFEPFDLSLPEYQTLPFKFEFLNQFHVKHGTNIEIKWPNDRPSEMKNYKVRKFMKLNSFSIHSQGELMTTVGWRLTSPA